MRTYGRLQVSHALSKAVQAGALPYTSMDQMGPVAQALAFLLCRAFRRLLGTAFLQAACTCFILEYRGNIGINSFPCMHAHLQAPGVPGAGGEVYIK
jgi:hypothetical protein